MSLTITVSRGLGDIPGETITCQYFSDEAVFTQRGRVEIDKATRGLKLVTITLPGMRPHVRPGQLVKIVEPGREFRAKVKSIAYSVGRQEDGQPYATCSLSLRMMEVV